MTSLPPLLDHRLLRKFLAVAEAGSVRGGAAKLNISQPPLTQSIQRLEESLGIELFIRQPKGMILTKPGKALADEARTILAHLERAGERVQAAMDEHRPIKIGFVSAALNGALTELLLKIAKIQMVRPVLNEMTTPEQISALAKGKIDLGLLHPPVDLEGFQIDSLGRDPFIAAIPKDHPLAIKKTILFKDIAHEPMVLFPTEQGPSLMGEIQRLCYEAGTELNVVAVAPRVHSQLAIVAGGLGISLVASKTAKTLSFKGVVFVPINDTRSRLFLELAIIGEASFLSRF